MANFFFLCPFANRILSRNRIAPDLVMDLPISNKNGNVHSSRESLSSTDDIGDRTPSDGKPEDMTTAERFATQNQCTLKKNERFSGSTVVAATENACDRTRETKPADGKPLPTQNGAPTEKPKAEVKPQENANMKKASADAAIKPADCEPPHVASTSQMAKEPASKAAIAAGAASEPPATALAPTTTAVAKEVPHKSPIPSRNTQKFVSQFADLHLTGGCLSTTPAPAVASASTDSANAQQMLTSFKPQIKVKPQAVRKPPILPATTPEMSRRNTSD